MNQRSISRYASPLAIVILLAGAACRTGKNYERPSVLLPETFHAAALSADSSSVADLGWKDFFAAPALQSLIDSGVHRNFDLMLALQRMAVAQQQVKQSRLLWFPQLDVQASANTNFPSKNSLNGISTNQFLKTDHVEDYLLSANLTWEVDIWGRISRQKESVLAQYLQTTEAARAVQTKLVADIASGYYNLLMLDQQLAVTEKNLELNLHFLEVTRLLYDAGEVTYLAVQQAQSQYQSTALLVPQFEQSLATQENALQLLTGQLPGPVQRDTAVSQDAASMVEAKYPAGIPAALLGRRPDVRAAEYSLVSANAQVGVARANMYPAINITAGGGLESFKASNWISLPNSLFGLASGAILQPVFRRRQLKTEYEIRKIEREQAVTTFRQSVLTATTEVSNALVQMDKLKTQDSLYGAQVDTLRSAVANAEYLFKSDMANYLEVITAQQNALQAELNLATIRRQEWSARIELYRALGGGWK